MFVLHCLLCRRFSIRSCFWWYFFAFVIWAATSMALLPFCWPVTRHFFLHPQLNSGGVFGGYVLGHLSKSEKCTLKKTDFSAYRCIWLFSALSAQSGKAVLFWLGNMTPWSWSAKNGKQWWTQKALGCFFFCGRLSEVRASPGLIKTWIFASRWSEHVFRPRTG